MLGIKKAFRSIEVFTCDDPGAKVKKAGERIQLRGITISIYRSKNILEILLASFLSARIVSEIDSSLVSRDIPSCCGIEFKR